MKSFNSHFSCSSNLSFHFALRCFFFHDFRAPLETGTGTAGISIVIEEEEEEGIGGERRSIEGGAMAGPVIEVKVEKRIKR